MGLLSTVLSKRTLITFVFLDIILKKLNALSKIFQNEKVILSMAIMATKNTINEFSQLCVENEILETLTSSRVGTIIESIKEVGLEVVDPLIRRNESVDWKTKLNADLIKYTNALMTEMNRRFGADTEFIIGIVPFNHIDWPFVINRLPLQNFDSQVLENEARSILKHINLSPQIDTSSSTNLYQSFLKDSYTRDMFREHSSISTLMLILPLGSCAVERCFSYSNRICSDSRGALTLFHVADLIRIAQQGPDFPNIYDIDIWNASLIEMPPENDLDKYIEEVYCLWRMSPRRL